MKKKLIAVLLAATMAIQPLSVAGAADGITDSSVAVNSQFTDEEEPGDENEINIEDFSTDEVFEDGEPERLGDTSATSISNVNNEDIMADSLDAFPATGVDEIVDCGICGENLTWEISGDEDEGHTLFINGTGDMYNFEEVPDGQWNEFHKNPWYRYRDTICRIEISNEVTSIGYGAFADCSMLTSVDLPEKITCIGERAFFYCSNLTSINLPEGLLSIGTIAFQNCSSLIEIELPEGLTSIGAGAFSNCTNLRKINIPKGFTYIVDGLFFFCSSLESIELPEGLTSIGNNAFFYCTSLKGIELPGGLNRIGSGAFEHCSSLERV